MRTRPLVLAVVVSAGLALALPPDQAAKVITRARGLLGVRYEFGGRARGEEGIDCQGLVFRAVEAVMPCGYQSLSVLNVNNVRDRELGVPVPGLSPVATAQLDVAKLEPGDVLMLVAPDRNAAEKAIGTLDGGAVWVWHVGLYVGEGKWIVGDHYAGQVVETDLREYLEAHADVYSGVFVTRMEQRATPRRCRAPRKADALVFFVGDGGV
jgi:cell wall-associated NlpC family hydrolase